MLNGIMNVLQLQTNILRTKYYFESCHSRRNLLQLAKER